MPYSLFISQFYPSITHGMLLNISGLNLIFLRPDRLTSRNDVTSNNVSFRPDIRQNLFLKKFRTLECVWLSKQFGAAVSRVHLMTFFLTFCAYASKVNLQPNVNFFTTIVYHFIHHARRKLQQHTKGGQKNHSESI